MHARDLMSTLRLLAIKASLKRDPTSTKLQALAAAIDRLPYDSAVSPGSHRMLLGNAGPVN